RALGFDDELGRRREAAGDDDARKIEREREAKARLPRRGVEPLEVANFALAEDQDAPRLQILLKAGEREAGLLHVRARDPAVQAVGAGEQVERQAGGFGPAAEQRTDGDAVDGCQR